ncbi:NADP-dependent glyceraldehyde-3-phosphate dehydrogenase [Flavobacterium xinjiangense]|uniref:Glyceraldehyde-3-phosphate dehydrogenase (NADP+) n=1 Tax=Flavobacterium xinjiangense TaxID=178356 RepID=A0A1M7PG42_9FLAO|nr:NADP-dependent glyceraldehyde-3-phosphate dehydrogenase [Flavobacterium xinjiangense]SHN15962.1 glyceraldehyde-3-phosphate dehydrogenase (NADP+) [Flavobacterium xinjiangense]
MKILENIFPTSEQIPLEWKLDNFTEQREYLINGELRTWNGPMKVVISPISIKNGTQIIKNSIGSTPLLTEKESLQALDSAVNAYGNGTGEWPTMSIEKRIAHIEQFVVEMKKQRISVVKLLMWEIGKNLPDSEKEFDRTIIYIEDTIRELKNLDHGNSKFENEEGIIAQIRRVPLGVALCMGPYNYPLNETFTTLIPALIMGNTVVFKPAKYGVLFMKPLMKVFQESFPKGVINIIYGKGRETVGAIMATGKIDVFAFIGINKGASDIKKLHPKPHRLRSVLGLDAKNPAFILHDADIDTAVSETIAGSLSFNGQRCTAIKIIFVHESIADAFLKKYTNSLTKLKFGMPWEKDVKITPLPEIGKTAYLKELVKDAKQFGADIINENGGEINDTFFYPAVLFPVNSQMRIYHEEQFGPVVPIVPYTDIEEIINYSVQSNFGQQLSVFGTDSENIGLLIDELANQVGRININAQCQRGPDNYPFIGRKDSAEGTLSVHDALRAFSIRILISTKDNPVNREIFKTIVRENQSNYLRLDYVF